MTQETSVVYNDSNLDGDFVLHINDVPRYRCRRDESGVWEAYTMDGWYLDMRDQFRNDLVERLASLEKA